MKEDRPGRLALRISVRMMIESNHRIVVMEVWSSRETECIFALKLVSTRVY